LLNIVYKLSVSCLSY